MPNIYPNLKPNFITVRLPEYISNIQDFKTSDYYKKNFQTTGIGVVLEFKYENLQKTDKDILLNFYLNQKHLAFNLPSALLASRFPSNIISSINLSPLWIFKDNFLVTPRIANKSFFNSDVALTIEQVFS